MDSFYVPVFFHECRDYVCASGIEVLVSRTVFEQGRAPILFSLQQMNPQMQLDMRPDCVLTTCEALGFYLVQATQASSSHIVIDLVALCCVLARALYNSNDDFVVSLLATVSWH